MTQASTAFSILCEDYPNMKYDKDSDTLLLRNDKDETKKDIICKHPTYVCIMMDKYGKYILSWHLRDAPYVYMYESMQLTDDMRVFSDIMRRRWANASWEN